MEQHERFEAIYLGNVDRVMLYCLRHIDAHAAEDVVSAVFMTAWRRLDAVPEPALPWLLVTAKNVLHSAYRSRARATALATRMAQVRELVAPGPDVTIERRDTLLTALGALSEDDREAVLLTSWDGLTSAEAARVLGTTAGALRVRLHRARARLALDNASDNACDRSSHA